jgi:hypothetical protein
VSLYLQIAVGAGLYLVAASHVAPSDPDQARTEASVRTVDLRALFDVPSGAPGSRVLLAPVAGEPLAIIADRVDGTVEYDDGEFRPLPPIGALGALIDAIAARIPGERPALRLRGEYIAQAAAAVG